MGIIDINNLSFRYKNDFIYDDFSLSIKRGSWTTIAGPNGSGKTTLVKLVAGFYNSYSNIKIMDKILNKKNLLKIRKDIGFCFDVPENYFACETVMDELAFSLENLAVAPKTIKKKLDEIVELFDLKDILDKNPMDLSGGQKQIVQIACALIIEPRILILDEALMMIDANRKKQILDIINTYNKKKQVTILMFTHDLNEAVYSDRLVVLNKGRIVIDGKFLDCFENENVMRKLGLSVPFEIEFYKKIKLYNLDCKFSFNLKDMVNSLWK